MDANDSAVPRLPGIAPHDTVRVWGGEVDAVAQRTRDSSTHTSRTTSGSTRVRSSSPLRSLQQTPERTSSCLSHFAGSGAGCGPIDWFTDQTGGLLLVNTSEPLRLGSGTEGAEEDGSDIAGLDQVMVGVARRGGGGGKERRKNVLPVRRTRYMPDFGAPGDYENLT